MPELPEVETTRRDLDALILGQRVLSAAHSDKKMRQPWPPQLAAQLVGRRLVETDRRAKYLMLYTDDDQALVIHLGMSGRVLIANDPQEMTPHLHLKLRLDRNAWLLLQDPRRFGSVSLLPRRSLDTWPPLSKLGVEPLGQDFTADYLHQQLIHRRTPIKPTLLDQQLVAGIGNIYASEALHLAGIDPQTPAASLSLGQLQALVPALQHVLELAIASGGSTLRDHIRPTHQLGGFQNQFQVYNRAGQPCLKPGCGGVIAKQVQAGRATYHCVVCQLAL
jgi:formamidopyrimidine-DNA glycosylase